MQASGRYTVAIHICLYLKFKGENLVSSQQIADSVKTNPVVIRRLVSKLRDAEIVGSVAGAKGGFFLKKPADKISLWDIYLAVRDEEFFHKPQTNEGCPVGSNLSVLVDDSFMAAEFSMQSVLGKTTVDQLNTKLSKLIELSEDQFC